MANTDYSETEGPKIIFGKNGEITDPTLLELIQQQEPLAPAALFKLARFFNNTLLNASLGESLQVSGLATIVGAPDLQQPIQQLFAVDGSEQQDQTEDQFPLDWPPAYFDDDSEDVQLGLSFIFVPIFNEVFDNGNSGLLIKPQDTETGEILYFIVGVCPNPKNLPTPSVGRA